MEKKLLIIGFPHCGTTILKTIIGHIDCVHEIMPETDIINIKTDTEYILAKYPFTKISYFTKKYKDYIKIFIIRNPLFVYSSLNKRFNNNIPDDHSIDEYIKVIKLFNLFSAKSREDIFTIKYEDLFNDNYINIKKILDKIGINYTDDIFDNTKFKNYNLLNFIPDKEPNRNNNRLFKVWQINNPLQSTNKIENIKLDTNQTNKLLNNKDILQQYPNLQEIINTFNKL